MAATIALVPLWYNFGLAAKRNLSFHSDSESFGLGVLTDLSQWRECQQRAPPSSPGPGRFSLLWVWVGVRHGCSQGRERSTCYFFLCGSQTPFNYKVTLRLLKPSVTGLQFLATDLAFAVPQTWPWGHIHYAHSHNNVNQSSVWVRQEQCKLQVFLQKSLSIAPLSRKFHGNWDAGEADDGLSCNCVMLFRRKEK